MKHRSLTLWSALTFVSAGAMAPAILAQNNFHLKDITWHENATENRIPTAGLAQGTIKLEDQSAGPMGGSYFVTVLDYTRRCPGAFEKFRVSWDFLGQNANDLVLNRPLGVRVDIQLVAGNRGCLNENPIISVNAQGNFQYPPGTPNYATPRFFDPAKALRDGAGASTPGPWQVYVYLGTGGVGGSVGFFAIHAERFGPIFAMDVRYSYDEVKGPPPPSSGTQILINWAARTGRFGSPVSAFTPYTSWIPGYTVHYMNFAYSGGRTVTVFLATNQNNPAANYVLYWDPDAEKWVGWFAA